MMLFSDRLLRWKPLKTLFVTEHMLFLLLVLVLTGFRFYQLPYGSGRSDELLQ